jgi:hypothetical protein
MWQSLALHTQTLGMAEYIFQEKTIAYFSWIRKIEIAIICGRGRCEYVCQSDVLCMHGLCGVSLGFCV